MNIKNIEKTKQMSALLLEQAEGYIKNRKINGFYIIDPESMKIFSKALYSAGQCQGILINDEKETEEVEKLYEDFENSL